MSLFPVAASGAAGTIGLPILVLLYWIPYRARARTLAREGRPVPGWRQGCYAAGLLVLALALSPPVGTLSDQLLVAHMAEHLLIGDIAALLLVLGLTGPMLAPMLRNRWIARAEKPSRRISPFFSSALRWHITPLGERISKARPISRTVGP